ncbi:MAG: hypothetical protein IAF08_15620 [Rhizobacter sp.]|nr:hypothetical protein [Chlorobiales bacterium]
MKKRFYFTAEVFSGVILFCAIFMGGSVAGAQSVSTISSATNFVSDGLSVDAAGNIYSSDFAGTDPVNGNGTTVYKITPSGTVSTFATGIDKPLAGTIDSVGNLYVCEVAGSFTGRIYKITPAGVKTVFCEDGLSIPACVSIGKDGNFYAGNFSVATIVKISPAGVVSPFVNLGGISDIAVDDAGNFYASIYSTGKIQKITPSGTVSTLATLPASPAAGLGHIIFSKGNLFVPSQLANRIFKVSLAGDTVSFAGTGAAGGIDGTAASATFTFPNGIAATPTGDTLYVAEYPTKKLRRITGVLSATSGTKKDKSGRPSGYLLEQNYPNPFNPSTVINYR